jgi:hypothetical protein
MHLSLAADDATAHRRVRMSESRIRTENTDAMPSHLVVDSPSGSRQWREKLLPILASKVTSIVFFVALLVLGLAIVDDYGVYIDEFTNHYFGVVWYHYIRDIVVHHAPIAPLASVTQHDVIHGPVFEMALAWTEEAILKISAISPIVALRHLATWLMFYLAVIWCYFIARRLWSSRPLALLACLLVVLHPRIFSHAFYDSVDISFLALYTGSLCTLVRYLERRTLGSLCLHAILCGLAIDVRVLGAAIPALTVGLIAIDVIADPEQRRRSLRQLGHVSGFSLVVAMTTIAFWPYLWTNPVLRFLDVIRQTPNVNWNGLVFYLGHDIPAPELPWHYIPVWILITTPVMCSGFFFVGVVEFLWATVRHPLITYRTRRLQLAVTAAALLPMAAVLILDAVVYDAWRHLYFIYPAFCLIAVAGIRKTWTWAGAALSTQAALLAKGAMAILIFLNITVVGYSMVRSHPYQNVQFNRLAGPDLAAIKYRFEMDYWGLSYRRALETIMKRNPDRPVKIYHGGDGLLAINRQVLPPADEARIQSVELDAAEFVLTTFRQRREGYPGLMEYFSVKVDDTAIVSVYRKQPKSD